MNGVSEDLRITFDDNCATSVFSDGFVITAVARQFRATCLQDLMYFPFDTQTCALLFESIDFGSNNGGKITQMFGIPPNGRSANTELYVQGGEFTYVSSTITNGTVNLTAYYMSYAGFNATFTFRRRPLYYVTTIVVPSVLLLGKLRRNETRNFSII